MKWALFQNGKTIGGRGPENGKILFDEELSEKTRITIEECLTYFAITCWISGWLVHTRFFNTLSEAQTESLLMKVELEKILADLVVENDSRTISQKMFDFVRKFP